MGISDDRKRCKRSHRPAGGSPQTNLRPRAGRAQHSEGQGGGTGRPWEYLLQHDDEGFWGEGAGQKVTWTLGIGPWEEALEDGWGKWHASRGLSQRYWGAAGNLGSTEGAWLLGLGEGYLDPASGSKASR